MDLLFGGFADTIVNGIIKLGCIAVLLVYSVFAVMVIRQINLMSRTFTAENENVVRVIGWVHLAATLILLLMALIF